MFSLSDKVVLITGASDGIGAKLAQILREQGARLSLVARSSSGLQLAGGGEALLTAGDITDNQVRQRAVQRTIERWGRLDVLINNAGQGLYQSASDTPLDEARRLMELNFFAPMALAQIAAPHLRSAQGTLVNVSSIAAQMSLPWLPVYSASKAALASITSSFRMEWKQHGVHAMCVFPVYARTDFQSHAGEGQPPMSIRKAKRFAVTADECARAIVSGIRKRKATVVVPRTGWALIWMYRLLPGLVESRLKMA